MVMELSKINISTLAFGEIFKKFFSGQKRQQDQTLERNIEILQPFKKIGSRFLAWVKKKPILLLISVLVVLIAVFLLLRGGGGTETFTGSITSPQKQVTVGKTFQFAGLTQDGRQTTGFLDLTLTSVETTKQILIQGKPATAKGGKIFLIINLEIDNPHNQKLFISPVDLIRLVAQDGKKFAPDVHNNQVSVEPISVKKTRVGFVIDEETSGWKLQIGEVEGAKETIDLPI
jgi:hypothetical protein